ncbi:phosphotransferase [Actinoplanes oblitus]|uniref:Phosphotransferase n=1 Tax=Actinoplanes oblitus TaxID=3040509 RepID=A0ABY8WR13_9ACTN|nr:phosphotransferase [Actinoplanes oblitus]WIM99290.1 phosphotransferase [Actinoplanes oblitus]
MTAPDPAICARWRLVPGALLGARSTHTWAVTRDGRPHILQRLDQPDWRYPLRVAAALREQGWPTPEPAEEPWATPGGVWLLTHRLPGRPVVTGGPDTLAQQRHRGRLLAELHAALAATGITRQRDGFREPAGLLGDPELERTLTAYERLHPDDGRLLLAAREATLAWFAANPAGAAPRGVLHGDFTPWNLLFEDGRLTGVLDFEASHRNFLVADFALAWRGYQDAVISGYHEVRPLSDLERRLITPVYRAWLFLGVAGADPATLDLRWNVAHLRRSTP